MTWVDYFIVFATAWLGMGMAFCLGWIVGRSVLRDEVPGEAPRQGREPWGDTQP